jgi:hypothetical protein
MFAPTQDVEHAQMGTATRAGSAIDTSHVADPEPDRGHGPGTEVCEDQLSLLTIRNRLSCFVEDLDHGPVLPDVESVLLLTVDPEV